MAKLRLEFFPDARKDVLKAYDWYAERSQDAADAFQDELEDARRAIEHSPERWSGYLFGTRRYVMKRFPFAIIYRITADRIEVVAVAHGRRIPGYWKPRVLPE